MRRSPSWLIRRLTVPDNLDDLGRCRRQVVRVILFSLSDSAELGHSGAHASVCSAILRERHCPSHHILFVIKELCAFIDLICERLISHGDVVGEDGNSLSSSFSSSEDDEEVNEEQALSGTPEQRATISTWAQLQVRSSQTRERETDTEKRAPWPAEIDHRWPQRTVQRPLETRKRKFVSQ